MKLTQEEKEEWRHTIMYILEEYYDTKGVIVDLVPNSKYNYIYYYDNEECECVYILKDINIHLPYIKYIYYYEIDKILTIFDSSIKPEYMGYRRENKIKSILE